MRDHERGVAVDVRPPTGDSSTPGASGVHVLHRLRAVLAGLLAAGATVAVVSSWWVAAVIPSLPDGLAPAADGHARTDAAAVHATMRPADTRPAGTVALVFTGGPVPGWTDRVLDLLHEQGTTATFFFEGTEAAMHPDLVRRAQRDGHLIGLTGLRGQDLLHDSAPGVRRRLGLANTMLAGITGRRTHLVRPLGLRTAEVADQEEAALATAAGTSAVVVVSDRSSRPPARTTAASDLVLDAQPAAGPGAVIEMVRPAEGTSAAAAASLDATRVLLAYLRFHEWTLAPADELIDPAVLPNATEPAGASTRHLGSVLAWLTRLGDGSLHLLQWVSGLMGVVTVALTGLVLVGTRHFGRRERRLVEAGRNAPRSVRPVSVVIPCRNERSTILRSLRALERASAMPPEVIVVDDGSTDGTADVVAQFTTLPVHILRLPPNGKTAALNAGIDVARNDVVVTIDADTRLAPGSLDELLFAMDEPEVGAASGSLRVEAGGGLVRRFQALEYAVANGVHRRAQAAVGTQVCVPGAFGAFRTAALRDIGGFTDRTVAEDTDATIALQRAGWQVRFRPDAVAYTLPPVSLAQLWRQRTRWSGGVLQALAAQGHGPGPDRRTGHGLLLVSTLIVQAAAVAVISLPADLVLLGGLLLGLSSPAHPLVVAAVCCQLALLFVGVLVDRGDRRLLALTPVYWLLYRPVLYLVLLRSVLRVALGDPFGWQPRLRPQRARPDRDGRRPPAWTTPHPAEVVLRAGVPRVGASAHGGGP